MVIRLKKPGAVELKAAPEHEVQTWVSKVNADFQTGLSQPEAAESFRAFVNAPVLSDFEESDGQAAFLQAFKSFDMQRQAIIQKNQTGFLGMFGKGTGVDAVDLNAWKLPPDDLAAYQQIQAILQDGAKVFSVLATLEALLASGNLSGSYQEIYQQLLNYLVFLPQQIGARFSSDPIAVKEILKPDAFLQQTVGVGRIPLDQGADENFYTQPGFAALYDGRQYRHGAMSHMIQWIVIALNQQGSAYENKVAHFYRHTADFRRELLGPIPQSQPALWSTLVDLPPTKGIVLDATRPEGISVLLSVFFPQINALEDAIAKNYRADLEKLGKKILRENAQKM